MLNLALFILRVVFGLLFIGHGTQKLFGWFGGGGLEATEKNFSHLDVYPARFWALVAALSEALGGLGMVLGLLTPLAAAALIGVMLVAIIKVHWKNGIWNTNRGIEYPLVNLVIALFLGLVGPGVYSFDAALRIAYPQPQTFLIALLVVIAGVVISLISGQVFARTGNRASHP